MLVKKGQHYSYRMLEMKNQYNQSVPIYIILETIRLAFVFLTEKLIPQRLATKEACNNFMSADIYIQWIPNVRILY